MDNDRYVFLVALGPVQDFIAAARRTRDLWFGSFLLSEVSKTAARVIAHEQGVDSLIFPAPKCDAADACPDLAPDDPTGLSVSNKIMAIIEGHPSALAETIRLELLDQLQRFGKRAFGKISGDFDKTTAFKQIEDMLEFFWVAVPLPSDKEYAPVRERAESLLNARKATRDFQAVPWQGNTYSKSSLDGVREALVPPDKKKENEDLYSTYGIKDGERLSGVDILKRHAARGEDARFFSTSHVASLPLLARFDELTDKEQAKQEFENYRTTLRDRCNADPETLIDIEVPGRGFEVFGNKDGGLLFAERLVEYISDQHDLRNAQEALAGFLERTVGRTPLPYYALLLADGDQMGKAIDTLTDPEAHHQFSQTLAGFSGSVRKIVEDHKGWLVYAGGDDVLAFVPLHTVLDCAWKLQYDFFKRLAPYEHEGGAPTLSVGVAIAHHLDPLGDTLELARAAEKEAKVERNALAVSVSKRSGSVTTVRGSWNAGAIEPLYKRLKTFADWHRQDAIPDGAAYELRELSRLDPVAASTQSGHASASSAPNMFETMFFCEAMRIFKRKRARQGTRDLDDKVVKQIRHFLGGVGSDSSSSADGDSGGDSGEAPAGVTDLIRTSGERLGIADLANELIVAKIFADAFEMAEPEKKEVQRG